MSADPLDSAMEVLGAFSVAWDRLELRVDRIEARLAALEGGPVPPPVPPPVTPPGKLERVPLTTPPLLYNRGSWDKYADTALRTHREFPNGSLEITMAQQSQPAERVVRHDFGLVDPHGVSFKREPAGVLRRYELKVTVPDDYDGAAEMVNLFQMHTHSAKAPPYWSFFLWSKDAYLRHNWPDGRRSNYNLGPIKRGHTYSLALEAVWSVDPDGRMRAWVDGDKLIDYSGPTYRDDEDEAPYLILGPYAPSAKEAFKATFVFSDFKMGDL